MRKIERIDRLTAPAVIGRRYLVPTIKAVWPSGCVEHDWPVIGPKHSDIEFINFEWEHYHVDARFVRRRVHRAIMSETSWEGKPRHEYFLRPLSAIHAPFAAIVWRPLTMLRDTLPYPFGDKPQIQDIRKAFAGRQCLTGKGGWICPHQKAAETGPGSGTAWSLDCEAIDAYRVIASSGVITGITGGQFDALEHIVGYIRYDIALTRLPRQR